MPEMTTEEAKPALERMLQDASEAQGRWILGLLAGNGAGLVTSAAPIIAQLDKPQIVALLLPSCWMFAAGLVLAGLGPGLEVVRHSCSASWLYARMKRAAGSPDVVIAPPWQKPVLDGLYLSEWTVELLACLLFVGGLLVPLATISRAFAIAL